MQFDSFSFVLVFLLLLVVDRRWLWATTVRNRGLLVASYAFYATWSPLYLPFLFGSTVLDYAVARRLAIVSSPRARRWWLTISLMANFSLLGWFKYAGFVHDSLAAAGWLAAPVDEGWGASFVPLGISFFTFQTVSYTIDVYHRRLAPTSSLGEFALYVSFFPQLVAGPIVLATELLPQLRVGLRATTRQVSVGGAMIVLGLFQKVVLADTVFRPVAEALFDAPRASGAAIDQWLGVYAFWGQLYCDFSGYSTMAIGMALCLGFELPENFRYPFAARSFAEFWRRWHITLTRWFGTYVYRPLGGRHCHPARSAINVFLVMVIAGLWHGASWTFVVWGALHGAALIIERLLAGLPWPTMLRSVGTWIPGWLRAAVICLLVGHSCVLFRAHDLDQAVTIAQAMYGVGANLKTTLAGSQIFMVATALSATFAIQWRMQDRDAVTWFERLPIAVAAPVLALMMLAILVFRQHPTGYLYFQF